jgi:glycosyltransferase involved in cell wall biosynthesis
VKIVLSSRERIWGGGEVFLAQLADEFQSRDHDVRLRVPLNSGIADYLPAFRFVDRRRPVFADMIVLNDFRSVWQSIMMDALSQRVFIVHGNWQLSQLRARILRAAKVETFVVSESVKSHAVVVGLDPERVRILPLGPSSSLDDGLKSSTQPDILNMNMLVFGTVARLDPIKRLDLFAKTVQELGAAGIIITRPPKNEEQERILTAVHQFPAVSVDTSGDPTGIWDVADVFLSTSSSESLGLAHLEALKHRIPVISTAKGGPSDFLKGPLGVGLLDAVEEAGLPNAIQEALDDMSQRWESYWLTADAVLRARGPSRCAEMLIGVK